MNAKYKAAQTEYMTMVNDYPGVNYQLTIAYRRTSSGRWVSELYGHRGNLLHKITADITQGDQLLSAVGTK
jgi:hypothetical protein